MFLLQSAFNVAKARHAAILVFPALKAFQKIRTHGPASRHLLGGQTMGGHRRRYSGGRSKTDFEQALAMARTRFPAPPRASLPLVESVLQLMQPAPVESPQPVMPPPLSVPQPKKAEPVTPPAPLPLPPLPHLRTEGALARFVPQWRIRR